MKPFATPILAVLAALTAVSAWAQAPKGPVTEVEGVEIALPRDPKVVATFPADGAVIPGGTVVLKIVFDQAMTPEAWSYGHSDAGTFPDCLARPRLLKDRRTFVLLCSLPPKGGYALGVNIAPGFVSTAGREAKPFLLHFSTSEARTSALTAALANAGVTDGDAPIMDWNGAAGAGVSTPPASATP